MSTNSPTLTPSIVRTIVPLIVGSLAAWVLTTLGVVLPVEATTEILTVLLTGLYYAAARMIEQRFPAFSWLLGSAQVPAVYTPEGEATVEDEDVDFGALIAESLDEGPVESEEDEGDVPSTADEG